ncbi:MAG: MFS transporter [Proteobacteria bacterium]|nr:MFS transporter [Pseudomonadota bacterium]
MNTPSDIVRPEIETGDPPHPEALPLTPSQMRRSLGAVIASAFAASLTFSVCMPLLALILERRGTSDILIGLNTAASPAGLLIFTVLMPRIVGRLGTMRALYLGFILMIFSIVLFPVLDNVWFWFPLRFLMGVGIAIHWVVSETWINTLVDNRIRGRVMGIYVTALSAGSLVGILTLYFVGSEGTYPFFIIAAVMAMGVMPLVLARDLAPGIAVHESFGLFAAMRRAPTVMTAALTDGFVMGALFAFFLIYAQRMGFDEENALVMFIVLSVGNATLQYLVGMLADRFNKRILLIVFALLVAAGTALLPFAMGDPLLLWPTLFLWGGIMGGIYTCGIALIGERFRRDELAAANASFIFTYEFGHLLGPAVAGIAMAIWDPHGLIVVAVGAGLIFALVAAVRQARMGNTGAG